MTTRRTFITGLLASAVAPAQAEPLGTGLASLKGCVTAQSGAIENPWPMYSAGYLICLGTGKPQLVYWSEPQDFTDWSPK